MKQRIKDEILTELERLIEISAFSGFRGTESGHLGGNKVRELEDLLCEYIGVKYAVTMNSATSCLMAACIACGVKDNYAVTTPVTFSATAASIIQAGGQFYFDDIYPDSYNLNLDIAHSTLNCGYRGKDIKAIIPVHLHGLPCDMDAIIKASNITGAKIIEDSSQALGSIFKGKKTGSIGHCGAFSFNQWKPVQCGEGGALVTNDENIARVARLVRNHGETQSNVLGYNFRLTELEAAVVIPQLKDIENLIGETIELCEYMTSLLSDVWELIPPFVPYDVRHVYYTYPVKVRGIDRDTLQQELLKEGVYFGNGGYKPLHLFPFYGGRRGDFPVAETCYDTVMYTNKIRPPMTKSDVSRWAEVIKKTVRRLRCNGT